MGWGDGRVGVLGGVYEVAWWASGRGCQDCWWFEAVAIQKVPKAADHGDDLGVGKLLCGVLDAAPLSSSDALLGPVRKEALDLHDEDFDSMTGAALIVYPSADGLAVAEAKDSCFLPCFLGGGVLGGHEGLDVALGDDPAAALGGGDEEDFQPA